MPNNQPVYNSLTTDVPEEAFAIIPAPFVEYLLAGTDAFGFAMASGTIYVVKRIVQVAIDCTGCIWFDVLLHDSKFPTPGRVNNSRYFKAPGEHVMTTLQASKIEAVFPLDLPDEYGDRPWKEQRIERAPRPLMEVLR